jgi:CheY-like chemotaxis protein
MVKYLYAHEIDMAVVMVSSADPNPNDLAQCRTLGIAPPLVKPVKTERLLEAIRHALDRRNAEIVVTPPTPVITNIPVQPLHILLVEDSLDNQRLILAYLKQSPHTIDVAENGEIAITKANDGSYDLIFMDMQMPIMDGYSATRKIREQETRSEKVKKATPIVALTAYALKEEVEKSYAAGCTDHLTKPIKKAVLLDMIGRYSREESHVA